MGLRTAGEREPKGIPWNERVVVDEFDQCAQVELVFPGGPTCGWPKPPPLAGIEEAWKKGAGPRAIYDELRLKDAGFIEARATLSAVKRVCARLKRARGVQPEDVANPVETRARSPR